MHSMYIFLLFLCCLSITSAKKGKQDKAHPHVETWGDPVRKQVNVRPTTGPGCPYAAAWLAHVSTFCSTAWYFLFIYLLTCMYTAVIHIMSFNW